jgi:peptidoglycan/xylan/chitin deacetylase (PgdA/CDA1 family)
MPTGPVAGAVDGVDGSVGQAADGSVGDGVDGSAGPVLPDPGVTPAPDGADTSANTPPDSQAGTPPTTPQAEAAAAATAPVDCSVAKCVALTFDDGPDRHTDKILDVLAAKGVKATFFVQGYRVALFPDQLKREAAEGHEIANHTWSHKNLTQLTPRAIKLQIKKTNAAVEEATGVTPKFVRPPYGAVSAKVEKYAGLPLVMWSVDTRDWETKKVKKIIRHIKKDTQPGAIVLMHDTLAATGKALGRSIDILRKQGYTFVTVSELLGPNVKPGHIYRER